MTLKKDDWLVLALAAAEGKPLSPVQLQKTLFLLQKELPWAVGGEFYTFRPYNYGPFDSAIYADATTLAAQNLVAVENIPGQRWSGYAITIHGRERANALSKQISSQALSYLQSLTKWVQSVSFRDLLKAVYSKYPEYAVNSVFRG